MAPSDRLKPVRRVAEKRENDAARVFGDAQRLLKDDEAKLEQLRQFQQEYRERFHAACREGMSGPRLQEYHAFLAKLAVAIDQQEQAVARSRAQREQKKQTWHRKHTRTQAIGKAIERFRKDEDRARERKEQKDSDELGLRRARSES